MIKIRRDALPKAATDMGFVRNPTAYESFGQYSARAGAKLQRPEMTEFEALRQLLPKQLLKLLRARARAYFVEKDIGEQYDSDGLWRYWAAVIAHGIVQYSTEDDAYVAEKSSVNGLLSNTLLRKLHTRPQWQQAKQAWTATRDDLTAHFNSKAKELWVPTQCELKIISLPFNGLYNFFLGF